MVLLTVFTILTLSLIIILYIKETEPTKRLEFNSLSTLLQTLFVFITLWIAIFTLYSSNTDTQKLFENLKGFNSIFSQMDSSLDDVSTKLKEMPDQIQNFSNSIDSLNIGMEQQKENFQANTEALNRTIKSLSISVEKYERNINNYSQQLETIVELTDKQLLIWKEQQKVLLDEFSRKPILKIKPKEVRFSADTCQIVDLVVANDGNIEANIRIIFLFFLPDGFIDLKSPLFKYYRTMYSQKAYRLDPADTNVDIIAAGSDIIIPCSIRTLNTSKGAIGYRIDYYSKYNSGKKIDDMIIQ